MRLSINDTIAAISTAVGEGGIGIVRISGPEAVTVVDSIFKNKKGLPLHQRKSHSILIGNIVSPEDGAVVDEVLVSVMRAPNTYTKEDVVEINCHGGGVALRKTLGLAIKAGARPAEPGEFTKRAFLNGRIDLAQAEAVIDIIKSRTEVALKAAVNQLEGGLSKKVNAVAESIAGVQTQLEAAVDFSDEDIDVLPAEELLNILNTSKRELEKLYESSMKGRILREGIRTAIVGQPNVGKSSLLNAILGTERAIVTAIPGTTRDVIEETISIKGIPLCLKDTAGIRAARDEVEKIGVELSRQAIRTSELVLCVVDGSRDIGEEDLALIKEIDSDVAILIVNKADLPQSLSVKELVLPKNFKGRVEVSALSGAGLEDLEMEIEEIFFNGRLELLDTAIITSARHEQLVERSIEGIKEAILLLTEGQPEEIISTVLSDVLNDLGEVTGQSIGEDVLGRIFGQFCIGK